MPILNFIETDDNYELADKYCRDNLYTLSPQYFGCVGDGVTDDTENFQKAINYVQTNKEYSLKLSGKYALTNITITDYCKIDFNSCELVAIGTSGVFIDINIPYEYNVDNLNRMTDNLKNIFINGNNNTMYTCLLSIQCRDIFFNMIRAKNCRSSCVKVSTYDGCIIDNMIIHGSTNNAGNNIYGLRAERNDTVFNNLEIALFNHSIELDVNLDVQFGKLHLWNLDTFVINVGIYCERGMGGSFDSIIFDTIKYCFDTTSNTGNAGFPCYIGSVTMFNIVDGGYLLNGLTYPQQIMMNINTLYNSDNSKICSSGPNSCILKVQNPGNNWNIGLNITFANYLINQIYFNVIGSFLRPTYTSQKLVLSTPTNNINLGQLGVSVASFMPINIFIGYVMILNSDFKFLQMGSFYTNQNREFLIYTGENLSAGTYYVKLNGDIPIRYLL